MYRAEPQQSSNRSKILSRILALRAVALLVAFAVLLAFQFYLERSLSYSVLYGISFAALCYSLATLWRLKLDTPVTDLELFVHLLMDAAILLVLVAFSGRGTNPFIYYLLVLVAISATLFSRTVSWIFAALAVLAYSLLLYFDLEAHIHHMFSDFQLHLVGMWVNFVGSTLLLNFFVSTLATALRDRERLLASAREENLKNEQLIAIGTLAASTVHALGTPLSTMAVMLGEMRKDDQGEAETLDTLLAQIQRCKSTMSKLSLIADSKWEEGNVNTVAEFANKLEEHYLLLNPATMPSIHCEAEAGRRSLNDSLLLLHAIINLIDNAIRAAVSEVSVVLKVELKRLQITISDDGSGVPLALAENFGKPHFSRQDGGLGIGIFLANTTVEKMQGRIILFNPRESRSGKTTVVVELPLPVT